MAVDETLRKLKFPARFVPYLEKHGIYELFYELVVELAVHKPEDHILFMKEKLQVADSKRCWARIVFIAPPHIDRYRFAEAIELETGIPAIYKHKLPISAQRSYNEDSANDLLMNNRELNTWQTILLREGYSIQDIKLGQWCPCAGYPFFHMVADVDEKKNVNSASLQPSNESIQKSIEKVKSETVSDPKEEITESKESTTERTSNEQYPMIESERSKEIVAESNSYEQDSLLENSYKLSSDSIKFEEIYTNNREKIFSEDYSESVESELYTISLSNIKACPCINNILTEQHVQDILERQIFQREDGYVKIGSEAEQHTSIKEITNTTPRIQDTHGTQEKDIGLQNLKTMEIFIPYTDNADIDTCSKVEKEPTDTTSRTLPQIYSETYSPQIVEMNEEDAKLTGSKQIYEQGTELTNFLNQAEVVKHGWILADYGLNQQEARELTRNGILPTHAIQLESETTDQLFNELTEGHKSEDLHYKSTLQGWKKAYNYVPITVCQVRNRSYSELAKYLKPMISRVPVHRVCRIQRIALIGPRGSGANMQAKLLVKKYNLVHVDFDELIARTRFEEHKLADQLREQEATRCVESELTTAILQRKLLSYECLQHGWVLTGYPRSTIDCRNLDLLDTPPNRVIFLTSSPQTCILRLLHKESSKGDTGMIHDSLSRNTKEQTCKTATMSQDQNTEMFIDIKKYFCTLETLKLYFGKRAAHVDAERSVLEVFEDIMYCVRNYNPVCTASHQSEKILTSKIA